MSARVFRLRGASRKPRSRACSSPLIWAFPATGIQPLTEKGFSTPSLPSCIQNYSPAANLGACMHWYCISQTVSHGPPWAVNQFGVGCTPPGPGSCRTKGCTTQQLPFDPCVWYSHWLLLQDNVRVLPSTSQGKQDRLGALRPAEDISQANAVRFTGLKPL